MNNRLSQYGIAKYSSKISHKLSKEYPTRYKNNVSFQNHEDHCPLQASLKKSNDGNLNKVFVGGIPLNIERKEVHRVFSLFGEI